MTEAYHPPHLESMESRLERLLEELHEAIRGQPVDRPRCREPLMPPSRLLPDHEPQPVAGGVVEVLSESQVALGGLDGGMPQRNLDLLERRPALVGELGEGAPQVVRRDPDADPVTVAGDGLEDRLRPERPWYAATGEALLRV